MIEREKMAECAVARCAQERRFVRKELQRWGKNLLFLVGYERVAQELMGSKRWRRMTGTSAVAAAASGLNEKPNAEPVDWNPDDRTCYCFCKSKDLSSANACSASSDEPPSSPLASDPADDIMSCTCDPPVDQCSVCVISDSPTSLLLLDHHQSTSSAATLGLHDQPLDLSLHSRHKPSISPVERVSVGGRGSTKNSSSLIRVPQPAVPVVSKRAEASRVGASKRGYTQEELSAALADIQSKKLGTRRAAVIYGIPRSTLRNKVYKLNNEKLKESERNGTQVPTEASNSVAKPGQATVRSAASLRTTTAAKGRKADLAKKAEAVASVGPSTGGETLKEKIKQNIKQKSSTHPVTASLLGAQPLSKVPVEPNNNVMEPGQVFDQNQLLYMAELAHLSQAMPGTADPNMYLPFLLYNFLASRSVGSNIAMDPRHAANSLLHLLPPDVTQRMSDTNAVTVHDYLAAQRDSASAAASQAVSNNKCNSQASDVDTVLDEDGDDMNDPLDYDDAEQSSEEVNDDNGNVILKVPSYKPKKSPREQPVGDRSNSSAIGDEEESKVSLLMSLSKENGNRTSHGRKAATPVRRAASVRASLARGVAGNLRSQSHASAYASSVNSEESSSDALNETSPKTSFVKREDGMGRTEKRASTGTSILSDNSSPSTPDNRQNRPKRGRYKNYKDEVLEKAVNAVKTGEMSVHRAGTVFGVPHSTLEYKVKDRHLDRPKKRSATTKSTDEGQPVLRQRRNASSESSNASADVMSTNSDSMSALNGNKWHSNLPLFQDSQFPATNRLRFCANQAQSESVGSLDLVKVIGDVIENALDKTSPMEGVEATPPDASLAAESSRATNSSLAALQEVTALDRKD